MMNSSKFSEWNAAHTSIGVGSSERASMITAATVQTITSTATPLIRRNSVARRPGSDPGPVGRVELSEDVADLLFDCALGEVRGLGDRATPLTSRVASPAMFAMTPSSMVVSRRAA